MKGSITLKDLVDAKRKIDELSHLPNVIASPFVCDWDIVERTWFERLFSLPWNPLKSTRTEYNPKAYRLSCGTIICSANTLRIAKKELLND